MNVGLFMFCHTTSLEAATSFCYFTSTSSCEQIFYQASSDHFDHSKNNNLEKIINFDPHNNLCQKVSENSKPASNFGQLASENPKPTTHLSYDIIHGQPLRITALYKWKLIYQSNCLVYKFFIGFKFIDFSFYFFFYIFLW